MPDLSNTPLAWNWNRAQDPNSSYGTRRLQFYTIEIVGYNINNEPGFDTSSIESPGNPDTYRTTYASHNQDEFLESPYSILYPILRGIAQVGEIYVSGEPNVAARSSGLGNSTYLTVALSADTVIDGEDPKFNSTSKSLQQAISQSISNFAYDEVLVTAVTLLGKVIQNRQGPNA